MKTTDILQQIKDQAVTLDTLNEDSVPQEELSEVKKLKELNEKQRKVSACMDSAGVVVQLLDTYSEEGVISTDDIKVLQDNITYYIDGFNDENIKELLKEQTSLAIGSDDIDAYLGSILLKIKGIKGKV